MARAAQVGVLEFMVVCGFLGGVCCYFCWLVGWFLWLCLH